MEQYKTELALLKAALWGWDRFPVETDGSENWESVFEELKAQTVEGVAVDALGKLPGVDPQVKRLWVQLAVRRMTFWEKLMQEQAALKALLDREGIPFVVLKGAAAAQYYPRPESRSMGDVDIIVKPGDFDRADRLLRDNGYEFLEVENDRHFGFDKNGVHIELHRYFSTLNDVDNAKALDEMIYSGIDKREYVHFGTYSVPVLPVLENGLVLLAHIDQHMEGGLGLRQITDWMLYADKNLNDDFWSREFGPQVRRLGMETLAVTVTKMCQQYLGLREHGITWCVDAEEDLCRELMNMILTRGNFGRKVGKSTAAVSILSAMTNVFNIPKLLQTRGCVNWKALKKYPFLRPFAWLYQLCRYVRKLFSPEYSLGQLFRDMRQVKPSQKVFEALGVRQGKKELENSQK